MVSVTCKLTADNVVLDVKLAKENWALETLDLQASNGEDWTQEKSVTFKQTHERASIWIHAEDFDSGGRDCVDGGLVVHCEATDTSSPWHNFGTNLQNWKSEDGKELCSNQNARFIKGAPNWLKDILNKGAEHIWVDGSRHVKLLGTPVCP